MTRSQAFLARLRSGKVLLADGAAGTQLQNIGLEAGLAPEAWVLERPDKIRTLHQSYVEAGANVILTCTFGGTRYRLAHHGLDGQVYEINRRAAELAREVASEDLFVAGDMGPTGQLLKPLGVLSPEEMSSAYAEQASGLADGGADFLLIETMSDLGEAKAAIQGARRTTNLPIVCTFSFDTHGRTMMGIKPEAVAQEIGPLVEGVGANCGRDPAEFEDFVRAIRQVSPEAIVWAKPNAGLPRLVGDDVIYDAPPEYMSQIALGLCEAGAQVVGGCCGTTPEHIAAMAKSLERASS